MTPSRSAGTKPAVARALVAFAAAVMAASLGCSRDGREVRGVLFVTLDTTRADRIGCYGYAGAVTPNLDALAAEGVRFDQAHSTVPVTLPAHASMFTGQVPAVHGVRYNGMFRLGEDRVTLAERFRDAGWATGAVPAAYPVNAETGLAQGFDAYLDMFQEERDEPLPPHAERSGDEITDLAIEWLDGLGEDEPFFLWTHYWDPHHPYRPPFPYSVEYKDRAYDGEIAFMDRELGRLFDHLRATGLWDDLLIVVVGDHGEGLRDHNEVWHSNLVYQTTIRVPMIVRAPDVEGGHVVHDALSIVDLAPTVTSYAGLDPLPEAQGADLRPYLEGGDGLESRPVYFEALTGNLVYGWSTIEGLRRGSEKLIRSSAPELFDIERDPNEQVNLYLPISPPDHLLGELDTLLAEWSAQAADSESTESPVDAEAMARLASLGYVGNAVRSDRTGGPAPRTLVHLTGSMLAGRDAAASGRHIDALRIWRQVLDEDPNNRYALQEASYAASRTGQPALSTEFASQLVEIYPEFAPGVVQLGMLAVDRGDLQGALEIFERGAEDTQGDFAVLYRYGVALLASGRTEDALAQAEKAVGAGASDPEFAVFQAACHASMGTGDEALRLLEKAVADGYTKRDVLETEPMLADLRGLDRFQAILATIPIPEPEESTDSEPSPYGY